MAVSIAVTAGLVLPGSVAAAVPASPTPSLATLVSEAAQLARQIDELGQQYDALNLQWSEAKTQVKIARLTAAADSRLLASEEASIAQIAAVGYMTGGLDPSLQLLESTNPQAMINRASILTELQQQNGNKINLVTAAKAAVTRASLLAVQEEQRAAKLADAMQAKVAKIQKKEDILNSAAFAQALAIYEKTGTYPPIAPSGDSVEVQALRKALTKVGDAYVWGAAGPTTFDCSGLVVWAYAQLGISLPHYTGWLWNEGVHVSRDQLQPGDLIFFFADLGHVGIYMGNGFMLDAPTFGIPVGVHQVMWYAYAGAVRIA